MGYALRSWVPLKKLDWTAMMSNPHAIKLILDDPTRINLGRLSKNPAPEAVQVLSRNIGQINWFNLSTSTSPEAMQLLRKHLNCINWWSLSCNPSPEAVQLLGENPDKIDFDNLAYNKSPEAIQLLCKLRDVNTFDIVMWAYLSANPFAIDLLLEHPEKINWDFFSANSSPKAVEILIKNTDKIDWVRFSSNKNPQALEFLWRHHRNKIMWSAFSCNPSAIRYLQRDVSKISWFGLSINPAIFVSLDECARVIQGAFRKSRDYAAWAGHPDRLRAQGFFNLDIETV